MSHILKSERGRRLEFGEESGAASEQVSAAGASVWGRLSAGFSSALHRQKKKTRTNKQLLDNNSADPSRVAAARGDGAVIHRGPSVCGRVNHQEESEEGKTAAPRNFIRLPPFPATCLRLRSSVSAELAHLRPHGAQKLGYAVSLSGHRRQIRAHNVCCHQTRQTSVAPHGSAAPRCSPLRHGGEATQS